MAGPDESCPVCGGRLCSHAMPEAALAAASAVDSTYLFHNPFVDGDGDGVFTAQVVFGSSFNAEWQEAIRAALDSWESVTNIDFGTHLSDPENTITFAFGTASAWGWATDNDITFSNSTPHDYREAVSAHEIGHVIGLAHNSFSALMKAGVPNADAPTAADIAITDALYGLKSDIPGPSIQSGGTGAQEIVGNAGSDIVYGNQGTDTLLGRGGEDTLYGGQDGDLIDAAAGADLLYGNLGADILSGGDGADTLYGGQGGDTLWGGGGDDLLFGNLGADLFVQSAGADTVTGFDAAEGDRLSGSVSSIAARDAGTLVTFTDGSSVFLVGVAPAGLDGAFV